MSATQTVQRLLQSFKTELQKEFPGTDLSVTVYDLQLYHQSERVSGRNNFVVDVHGYWYGNDTMKSVLIISESEIRCVPQIKIRCVL
jgi:hypothetical protein